MTDSHTLDVVVRAVGWALVHSAWQGALTAALAALVLRVLGRRTANARYLVACLGLFALVASWTATAVRVGWTLAPSVQVQVASGVVTAPVVELGPAGPLDFSPAIRPLRGLETVADQGRGTWRARLDAWSTALVPLWLAGVLLLSARLALAWLVVERLRRAAGSPVSAALLARVDTLARRLRIRRAFRVAQSAAVQVPMVIGWLRPVVLLPASVLTGLTPEQLEAVLAHELAHIRRHDYAVNVLQSAAEVLLFYHPACWWLSHRIRVEREHCCDDVAVALCGDRVAYATALADLESLRSEPALALAATDGPLLQRVRHVIGAVPDREGPSAWAAAALPLIVVALLVVGVQATGITTLNAGVEQSSVPTPGRIIPADEAVVQGRVVDAASGRPISGATVLIVGPESAATVMTGGDGRYEAGALKPGSYRLSVKLKGYVEGHYGEAASALIGPTASVDVRGGRVTTGIDVGLQRAGSLSGRIWDARGEGLAGVEVELVAERAFADGTRPVAIAFAQTGPDGSYGMRDVRPGDYYVRAYTSREAPGSEKGPALAYAPSFYPSVTSLEEAQRLRLYAGQDLLDVDFALATSRKFTVSGTVVDPSGEALGAVGVVLHSMGASGGPSLSTLSADVDREGRFEIRNVAPGAYMLNVRDSRRTSRWVSAMQMLTVDADVADLELRAVLGARVEGRVVRDLGATSAFDPTQVGVGFEKRLEGPLGGFTGGSFKVGTDGAFSLESPGGPVTFKVTDVPAGWMVRSISVDGSEIGDEPSDFGSGRRQVEVVLTDKVTVVSGVVVDRKGQILPNYSVVLFPPDPTRWHPSSRFILAARSNNAGQFHVEAVPPGDYLAVAVAGLPMNAWQNPDVLTRLQTGAERIRVAEGERVTISIRASPTPDGLGVRRETPRAPDSGPPVLRPAPWAGLVRWVFGVPDTKIGPVG